VSDRFDDRLREARAHLGVPEVRGIDWEKVDAKLFGRIEREKRAEQSAPEPARGFVWGTGAAVLAAAAAVALIVGKTREPAPLPVAALEPAGNVVAVSAGGELLVDGKHAGEGTTLHLDDVLEARGSAATIERAGKLTMVLEAGSRATVTHVQGALVLALAAGAVEAQVVPVPSGEAFAVDVDGARVAVHGTHLRVARVGDHVSVDLNEGVVSLGPAPREGSTVGALVVAPAHAEFVPADAQGSLVVSHEASAVRAPVALGPAPVAAPVVPVLAPNPAPKSGAVPPPPAVAGVAARPAPVPSASAPVTADPNAAANLAAAIAACAVSHPMPANVTGVIDTTLHLELDADGVVRSARFEPAVPPDVNACAAPAIYKARFGHSGSVDIPVNVTVPSSAP
jgi:hypothetical protein